MRRAGDRQLLGHPEQRLVALGEVGGIGQPVVHLEVDVGRVLAAPGRIDLLVPDALQVGGLTAGPRRGDHQVAAVLDVERGERGIGVRRVGRDALIGRQVGDRRRAEIDREAAEQPLVVGDVRGAEIAVAASPQAASRRRRTGPR